MFGFIKKSFEPQHIKKARRIFNKRAELLDGALDTKYMFSVYTIYESVMLQTSALVELINPSFMIGEVNEQTVEVNRNLTEFVIKITHALIEDGVNLEQKPLIEELIERKHPTPSSDINELFSTNVEYCDVEIKDDWVVTDIFAGTITNTYNETEKKRLVFCIAGILSGNKNLSNSDRLMLAHLLVLRSEQFEQLTKCSLI